MSLSPEPGKGLRLKLGRLSPIRTWHGGGNFWSHEFQLTIRSGALAGFLPRAMEDEDSVLFEHRSGGTEQAGTSSAIGDVSEIPARELQALRAAVDDLKKKAEDPHCDRTKRQMIESFRLPDPQKDRDLYRLIGKGSGAKLIVLWGIEREEGSALSPGAAVDLMHTAGGEAAAAAPKRSKLVPVLLFLSLVGGGGWYYWQEKEKARMAAEMAALAARRTEETQRAEEAQHKAAQERERSAAASAAAAATKDNATAGSTPTTAAAAMPPVAVGSPAPKPAMPAGAAPSDAKKASAPHSTAGTDAPKKATEPPKAATASSTAKPTTAPAPAAAKPATSGSTTQAAKPISAAPGTIVRNSSSGSITGVVGKDGKVAQAKPGTSVGKDGKVTTSAPGTVTRGSSGACTGVCGADGKVVPATLGRIVEDSKGTLKSAPPGTVIRDGKGSITGVSDAQGKIVPATPGTVLDKEGKIISSSPGTVLRDSHGTVTGVADADGKIVNAAPGAVLEDDSAASLPPSSSPPPGATPPGSITTPMTAQGALPGGISSLSVVSTSLSGVLGNGHVEVLLNVVARDTAGAVVNAPQINGWKVNGQLQNEPDGTPAHGPVIPVSLPPGTHRISTVGRGADGQPFQTDADVVVSPKP